MRSPNQIPRLSSQTSTLLGAIILAITLQCSAVAQEPTFHVTPAHPIEQLRASALKAHPPQEPGPFLPSDLVELTKIDPALKLDIRYAAANNFLGSPVYTQARAFLQRPAAQALARADQALHLLGYGLVIHDAYRPWYVTKIFWDATPGPQKKFVANPQKGSRHNRGCAVDLSLVDLKTGREVEMPSAYDEFSDRAYANYPGGTAEQRRLRGILRAAMLKQGFSPIPTEWWHFDFKGWRQYPILNVPFEDLRDR